MNQTRIPRVPVRYPLIPLLLQYKSELTNSGLRNMSSQLWIRRLLQKILLTHQLKSSDTLVTGTVVVNSPAPACESVQDADLFAADIPTLQDWQRVASENVATLTTRLARARDNLWRITKRLKTMQDGKEPDTPPASPFADIVMEIID